MQTDPQSQHNSDPSPAPVSEAAPALDNHPPMLWYYRPGIDQEAEASGYSGLAPDEIAACRRFAWPALLLTLPVAAFFLYILFGVLVAIAKMLTHLIIK
jgi:hypothetical protein